MNVYTLYGRGNSDEGGHVKSSFRYERKTVGSEIVIPSGKAAPMSTPSKHSAFSSSGRPSALALTQAEPNTRTSTNAECTHTEELLRQRIVPGRRISAEDALLGFWRKIFPSITWQGCGAAVNRKRNWVSASQCSERELPLRRRVYSRKKCQLRQCR